MYEVNYTMNLRQNMQIVFIDTVFKFVVTNNSAYKYKKILTCRKPLLVFP